jgi:ribosomal protein L37AE/L43A
MKIKEITKQHRRDFTAIYECEHCGDTEKIGGGYDDAFYHANVIPSFECKKCKKKASDNYEPRETKYPEGCQV